VSTPPAVHPIRLVVDDDLERSRLTVFFRLLLVIPHYIWFAVFGIVAFFVVVINWFATLIRGESPRGLFDFLAGYIRYGTHVYGYLYLAASPYPKFYFGSRLQQYPIDLEIDGPAPQNRWVTGFRLVLVLPALVLASTLAGSSIGGNWGSTVSRWSDGSFRSNSSAGVAFGAAATAAFLTWFAALARKQAPRGLRDLTAWGLGYAGQTYGYLFVITDSYPYTGPDVYLGGLDRPNVDERVPRLVNTDDLRRSRLTVLFRLPLAVPHILWLALWTIAAILAAIANWFATLAVGRSPRPLARFLAAYVRYHTHVYAFLLVVGNLFPGFVGKEGSYPVEPRIRPFEPQSRWITLFRIILVIPAFLVSAALAYVLFVAAVFSWFVSLARARVPTGLQSAGAYALGYAAQFSSYGLILTDRYPHASPAAVLEDFPGSPALEPELDAESSR
jgi:Domain of unknown function (DUF4389)